MEEKVEIQSQEFDTNVKNKKKSTKKKYILLLLLAIFIGGNISFYFQERAKWIYNGQPYPKAKEYYVLGNMVFFYRKMLNIFVEIDNPIMSPLNTLQESIYNKGIKYLPENDAEIAVWRYKFFLYFYTRKNYLPDKHLSNSKEISKKRVKVLDDMYWAIEALATKEIADEEMNRMKYKIFPFIVSYYELAQWNYFGSEPSYSLMKSLMQNKEHMQRIINMIDWLVTLKKEWSNDLNLYKEINSKHPEVVVYHYRVLINFIEAIFAHEKNNKTLKCNNSYIGLYVKSRKEVYGDGKTSSLFKLKKGQDKVLYQMIFQTQFTKILLYEFHAKCGTEFKIEYPSEKFINEIIQPTNKPKKQGNSLWQIL